ncbi:MULTISPECIES: sulfite exporter TauE/SafE family protein [Gammaproteobacteria]|uniref:sulfite exporter TauE/SafE family protein n=1 Tax=Gammaproteobacteria TaxID=1236 RepID=UPI001ADAD1F1|nr:MULTISPECIES: sulfite exporter TauE/SafE family protein [Gammaproteobacteria]MBO9481710.1 sulfite exporter TauE/SafE family protein [Salinisphaera sp. G21_0]MBO9495420.1 sulfite exporter TauE/SafE family protein [Thalassotalea sp. G20_0]
MDFLTYIATGAGVGFAVGLTGIGGGSLMTPLLLMFGFPAHIAIGTDLMYAAITKSTGVIVHHRQKSIDWTLVKTLCAGSLPATILTIVLLKFFFDRSADYSPILTLCLGIMLTLTALSLFMSPFLKRRQLSGVSMIPQQYQTTLTFIAGIFLGVLVTLSSVGAGALGTAAIILLYPLLKPVKVVGSDLAHAVPLTLLAGFGHIWLGNVDFVLLGSLLIGSIPAIYVGTRVGMKLPDTFMRIILAIILLGLGLKYLF